MVWDELELEKQAMGMCLLMFLVLHAFNLILIIGS